MEENNKVSQEKVENAKKIANKLNIETSQIAYVGDDIIDLSVLNIVALPAPKDR